MASYTRYFAESAAKAVGELLHRKLQSREFPADSEVGDTIHESLERSLIKYQQILADADDMRELETYREELKK